jgi:ATP-dependent exoDNAse (exonuclease V) beta subunit
MCHVLARLVGATHHETTFATEAVLAALAHPRLSEARSAKETRREVAIAHCLDDGSLAEGIIDLAYCDDSGWVVIDFKTDAVIEPDGAYAKQLQLYVEAVRRATGGPTRGVLLNV